MDVMTANTYSKAVLRAACEEMVSSFDFIDYYPSFESIILSERGAAWQEDQVHPTPQAIELNCGRMIEAYARHATDSMSADDMRVRIAAATNPQSVFGLLDNRRDLIEANSDLAQAFCEAALRVRRFEDADAAFPYASATMVAIERDLLGARIALAMDRPGEAIKLLTTPPKARIHQNMFYATLTKANIDLNNLHDARESARFWVSINPRTPEPYRMLGVAHSASGDFHRADNYFRQALELADDQPHVLLDYVEHLERSDRRAEAEAFLSHIDPLNGSHEARIRRLMSDL